MNLKIDQKIICNLKAQKTRMKENENSLREMLDIIKGTHIYIYIYGVLQKDKSKTEEIFNETMVKTSKFNEKYLSTHLGSSRAPSRNKLQEDP